MQDLKAKFDAYYNSHLLHKFAELEEERQKQLTVFIRRLLVTGAFIPLLLALFWNSFWGEYIAESREATKVTIYVLIFYVIAAMLYCHSPVTSFKLDVKADIMQTFAAFWGDFLYVHGASLPEGTLIASNILPYYDSRENDDYFQGCYHDVNIIISEPKLYKKVRTRNGSHNVKVFEGIIIQLEINKDFKGKTVVLKDCGLFNIFKKIRRTERVKLEDVVFEKHFEVFSDNQIEARYLLTTAFMERMLKAKKVFHGKTIQFSFFDNKLLIAIETNQNMFEVSSLFSRTTNRKMINQAFEQFTSVMALVDTLKLQK